MTRARDLSKLLSTSNGKIEGGNLDVSFENITDTGTEGTKVATGTSAERGSTAGQFRFNSTTGKFEGYDGSGFKEIDSPPTVTSIDDTEVDSAGGGNQTIVITGTNFQSGATVTFVGSAGTDFNASTVTVDSDTQITAVAPKASFLNAQEPYGVKVTNLSGLSNTLSSQINVDTAPSFDVASGSLGTLNDGDRNSSNLTSVTATDPDGDAITFSQISGTLPTGITFNSDGTFSGTADAESSDTTYTFTIRATANSKTSDRQYTINVNAPIASGGIMETYTDGGSTYVSHTFLSSGTFTLNTAKALNVLLVAGGGGAGGMFTYSATPSAGNYPIVIGAGGAGGTTSPGSKGSNTTGFSQTAAGGGRGGSYTSAGPNSGGSGAGGNGEPGGLGTGASGISGQGNSGGNGSGNHGGGGGGGKGASGSNSPNTNVGGTGGIGGLNNYRTGSDQYYAGGGGGGTWGGGSPAQGGNGGGGNGSYNQNSSAPTAGTINTGGGGGGSGSQGNNTSYAAQTTGGSGILVVRYQI